MAEMTIRLQCNPRTGEKDIFVSLSADAELLPFEQERRHRELVERLLTGGWIHASERTRVVIQREEEETVDGAPGHDEQAGAQPLPELREEEA